MRFIAGLSAALLIFSSSARAVDGIPSLMAEVGVGLLRPSQRPGSELLFKLGLVAGDADAGISARRDDWMLGKVFGHLAHLSAEFSLIPNGPTSDIYTRVPYSRVRVTPIELAFANRTLDRDLRDPGEHGGFSIQALPFEIQRNLSLDQTSWLRISLAGAGYQHTWLNFRQDVLYGFWGVETDVLGYMRVGHNSALGTFYGARVLGLEALFGIGWKPRDYFAARWILWASADASVGGHSFTGPGGMQSDVRGGMDLKFDFGQRFQLFLSVLLAGVFESGAETFRRDSQLQNGLSFLF